MRSIGNFLIESLRAGLPERVPCGQDASLASETTQTESACAPVAGGSDGWRLAFDRRAGFGKRPGGEPVPSHLAGIHDVRQAGKRRVGEPICADRCQVRSVFYVIILIDPPSREESGSQRTLRWRETDSNSPARRFCVSNLEMRQRDTANRPERRSVGCGSFESRLGGGAGCDGVGGSQGIAPGCRCRDRSMRPRAFQLNSCRARRAPMRERRFSTARQPSLPSRHVLVRTRRGRGRALANGGAPTASILPARPPDNHAARNPVGEVARRTSIATKARPPSSRNRRRPGGGHGCHDTEQLNPSDC
jgi:hypothetical protein